MLAAGVPYLREGGHRAQGGRPRTARLRAGAPRQRQMIGACRLSAA